MQTQTCDDIEERDLVDNDLQETQQTTGSTSQVFNCEFSGFMSGFHSILKDIQNLDTPVWSSGSH